LAGALVVLRRLGIKIKLRSDTPVFGLCFG